MIPSTIPDTPPTANWPTSQIEAWKYTDLRHLAEGLLWNPGNESLQPWFIRPHEMLAYFSGSGNPKKAVTGSDAFTSVIHSGTQGGWQLHIPAGLSSNTPLRVVYTPVSPSGWSAFNHHLYVEQGAHLTLIEENEEEEPLAPEPMFDQSQDAKSIPLCTMTMHHLQVHLERGAELKLIRIFRCPKSKAFVHQVDTHQEEGSKLEVQTVAMGSGIIRNNVHIQQRGNHCSSGLLGLSVAFGGGHIDQYSRIQHHSLEGNSHQHYKAIAAINSTTIFNGVLRVEPQAQQTNAYQRSSNLMLDPAAHRIGHKSKGFMRPGKVNAKPELQIFADNVKCSHGATVGKLNTDSIFYLQSRGLSFEEAQRILTLAFAMEIIDQLEDESLRSEVIKQLDLLQWH